MENKETGEKVEDNDFVRMQMRKLKMPTEDCQHCYCRKTTVYGKAHYVCCMCAHRTLVNPINY